MVKYDSVTLYRIRKLLSDLEGKKGRGTELISLYIPSGRPVHDIVNILREEYGTAANIKSDTTRNNVQSALMKIMQRLKLYTEIPENGLVIFCGALPLEGSSIDEELKIYEIIPPKPITTFLYRCDDHFHVDILKNMLKEEEEIGIISIDTSEAGLGIVSGDRIYTVDVLTSGVGGKHRQGGQSARRFERLREVEINEFYKRVAKHAAKAFLEDHNVKYIVISGPGVAKEDFYKGEYLDYRLQRKVIGLVDTGYAGEEGIRETVHRGKNLLQDVRYVEEQEMVEEFLSEVSRGGELVSYGIGPVLKALELGAVDKILIVDDIEMYYLSYKCTYCGYENHLIIKRVEKFSEMAKIRSTICPSCGRSEWSFKEEDIVEYLSNKATESGARVEVISSKTEYGRMFRNFGGIGAFLRYKVSCG